MPAKHASPSILFVFYPKRSYAAKQTRSVPCAGAFQKIDKSHLLADHVISIGTVNP